MQYVKLGNTGVDVSRICLGMMSFGAPGPKKDLSPTCCSKQYLFRP